MPPRPETRFIVGGNNSYKRLDKRIMDADRFMMEESCGPLAAKVRVGLLRALDASVSTAAASAVVS